MKHIFSFIAIILLQLNVFAQNEQRDAIVQYKKDEYIISGVNKVIQKRKYKVEILTQEGQTYGNVWIGVDNTINLKSFKAKVTDAAGNRVGGASKADLYEADATEYSTLYSGSKLKYTNLQFFKYPYTVEYEYEMEYNVFLGGSFSFIDYYNVPVKDAELVVKVLKGAEVFYKTNNFKGKADILSDEGVMVYSWKENDLKALDRESFSPSVFESAPLIFISPKKINYNGFEGQLDSWKNYGKWSWSLVQRRNLLPAETNNLIFKLTESEPDTINKIKILYKYLQANTRYVGIQGGINGYQPFPAAYVDKSKYGDCKGLSNYMKSLLEVIGVHAFYTEIGNGSNTKILFTDFPSFFQTNHVVLMVPVKKDTIWLECTSKSHPFGYIGRSNSDRFALAISDSGGVLVRTPEYALKKNYSNVRATIEIVLDGSMECTGEYHNSGIMIEELIGLKASSRHEQSNYFIGKFHSKDLSLKKINIDESKDDYSQMSLSLEMKELSFASKAGTFYTFTPNYLSRLTNPFGSVQQRFNDIQIDYGFQQNDTINFSLPAGLTIEHLPKGKNLETEFGKFHTEYVMKGEQLIYIRNFTQYKGTFSKEKFQSIKTFYKEIEISDLQRIILKPI